MTDAPIFQLINALQCCATGLDGPRVPLIESDYRDTYGLLLSFIEKDWNHRGLGKVVQATLEKLIDSFRYGNSSPPSLILTYPQILAAPP